MADISKLKVLGTTYDIKDAQGRANLTALSKALGTAAYKDVLANIDAGAGEIIDAATVKSYVDAQVGAIHKFDVVVVDSLPTAAESTMYKIYLIPTPGATDGSKDEHITIRSGSEGAYTYAWELIGSTKPELADYVKKTQKVAGIDLQDDITVAELQTALELGALAYLDEGSVKVTTADSLIMDSYTPTGAVTINDLTQTPTNITSTGTYTPAGSITGDAIKGGSINVTLKDAATVTDAVIADSSTYTPAGTVAAVDGGSFSALKSATFQADSTNGVQIEGTVSAPAVNLTSSEANVAVGLTGGKVASFTEGEFTPASISDGFFSAGSLPTKAADTFTAGSFTKGSAVSAAIEGVVASVGTGDDAETLILTAAQTDEVMDHDATFTAPTFTEGTFSQGSLPSIDATKFNGGSKVADTFEANELQTASMGKVNNVTAAALANAPVFTGAKYAVATTDDTALKTVAFTATNNVSVPTQITYVKQEVDAKTFTPVAAELGFSGTEGNVSVSGSYDKATANGASFTGTIEVLTGTLNKTEKTIDVDFE